MAQATAGELYRQGALLERAENSMEQIVENVAHAGRMTTYMSRWLCFRVCACAGADGDRQRETHYKTAELQR